MGYKHIYIALLGLFGLISGYSQTYKFKIYSYKDGLPQDYIYSLSQSKRGNLWIGTAEGLARFNGKEILQFSEKEGFTRQFITTTYTDSKGRIWIGNFEGQITLYTNTSFQKIKFKVPVISPVTSFFEDDKGNILAGTKDNGLILINQKLEARVFSAEHFSGISSFCKDKTHIYIGTSNGIKKIEIKSDSTVKVIENYMTGLPIQSLYFHTATNEIYAGTSEDGLYCKSGAVKDFTPSDLFSDENINIIVSDSENNIWVSSFGKGVYKCRLDSKQLKIQETFSELTGLPTNYIKSFFIDRENNIWFGTYGSGLALLVDPIFTLYTQLDGLPENNIKVIKRDLNKSLWIASENQISILKDGSPVFKPVSTISLPAQITSISFLDSLILIGTTSEGVFSYSGNDNELKRWFYSKNNPLYNNINHMVADKMNNVWMATDMGVVKYSNRTQEISVFTMVEGLPHNKIFSLFCDKRNRIWVGTRGGGLSYIFGDKVNTFPSPFENRRLEINAFAEDHLGGIWIGTYGQGLFLFQNDKFLKWYDERSGLSSPFCYSLIFDANKNLWVGHKSGLTKFEPLKEKFTFFESREESAVSEINNLASEADGSGNIWFGTINGALKYNPKADKEPTSGPIVNLTNVLLNFQEVNWKQFTDSIYGFGKIPYNLTLPYNKNHLTFNVIGVSLKPGSEKVMYQYMLEGFEKEWSLVTNEPFVTYANLPPGTYNLKVRAGLKNDLWTEMPDQFTFTILSPFWKTWWFTSISVIFMMASVVGIVKIRTDRLRAQRERLMKDKMILEAEIKERIKAQEQQKLVEEKLKQTNQELNNFIYRSSHDLRGPISTVKGLTQLGVVEVKDAEAKKFFNLILDRTHVLDSVLKNLINIVEVIEGEITLTKIEFPELANKVLQEIESERSLKDIQINLQIEDIKNYTNDQSLIYTVFKNIIENSVKYKKPEGQAEVDVQLKSRGTGIEIRCSDNGIGIEKGVISRVFDMFYRGTDESKGSGLGLYTVKKIVEKLNGKIEINSQKDIGTELIIYLPDQTA